MGGFSWTWCRARWSRLAAGLLVGGISTFALVAPAGAQPEPPSTGPVRFAVHVVPPFVIREPDGSLSGFSVELAELVAERAGFELEFVVVGDVQAVLDAVESGEADAAIGAISITAGREERVDFSQPYFDSGIQIAANKVAPQPGGLSSSVPRVLTGPLLLIVVIAVLGTLLAGAVVWWLERKSNEQFANDGSRGVLDGVWWATETLFSSTYGDAAPRRLVSRAVATVWMIISVLLIATLIAQVTAEATVERLEATITSVDDLRNRRVVTVGGTTSEAYLAEREIQFETVATTAEGLASVAAGDADAVVSDSAILRHLVYERGGDDIQLVGVVLRAEDYGIAVGPRDDLLEPINRALLQLNGSTAYDRLVAAYFG